MKSLLLPAMLCLSATWAVAKDEKPSAAKPAAPPAKEKEPRGEKKGGVDWEDRVIKATGAGAPDLRASTPAQARLMAEKAAQLDAFRNLLAQVKGIRVSATKTVGDEMQGSEEVRAKVEGVIKGFKITGKRYYSDGGVELDVEVPLSGVSEVFVKPSGGKLSLKTDGEKKNTGLVIDARGLEVSPALAPRLVDEKGNTLYAAEVVTEEVIKSSGIAGYAKNLDQAKKDTRVGDKPLIVKASRSDGCDLVLSAEDAKKLTEANNSYLAEGRVLIVTN